MEYATPLYIILGFMGVFSWFFLNIGLFKKAQIYMPLDLTKKKSNFIKQLVTLIGLVAWMLISYSLMQPRIPTGTVKGRIQVNDIFFIVDVSRSMSAWDFKPNRLEAAKREIKSFINLRPEDRIGLIMFSDNVFTLLPLSTDLDLIENAVDEIKMGPLGSGTNIGDALGLAVARGGQSLAENKIIILLTDGVSNVGALSPLEAAEHAKNSQIKVYTIAMGKSDSARIPTPGPFGTTRYQNIPGGSVDLETLKKIAAMTGGQMYVAGNTDALNEILKEINAMEKTDIEVSHRVVYEEKFYDYLFVGVILLLFSHILRYALLKEIA